jgi:hypothetical protein
MNAGRATLRGPDTVDSIERSELGRTEDTEDTEGFWIWLWHTAAFRASRIPLAPHRTRPAARIFPGFERSRGRLK